MHLTASSDVTNSAFEIPSPDDIAFGKSARRRVRNGPRTDGCILLKVDFLAILLVISWRSTVGSSQKRAIQNYRSRLSERGMARFEVLGLDSDRDLIRSLARRLAQGGPEASRLRAVVSQAISGEPPKKGGILAALRRSPMVGADLDPTRPREEGRKVDL
jgi:hypothetical protein